MSDNNIAFQSAIFGALNTALGSAPVVPVYDFVPQGTEYPYVTIDYQDDSNADFLSARKTGKIMYLSVWSDYRGQKEVLEIMSRIDTALHQKELVLSSGRIAQMRILSKRTNREPDGLTYMGQVRLQVLLEH
jgi:hypothetical protein